MKSSHTIQVLMTSVFISSGLCSITTSMEKKSDIPGEGAKAALPSLRSAAMGTSSGKQPTSPGRDEVLHSQKVITHPTVLTHDQLRKIFTPRHEHDLPSTIESRKIEVDIAGQKVQVFAAPKSHKDDEVRNLFKVPTNNIIGKFKDYLIERRGEAHTMAAAGADCATIPGYLLYFVKGDQEVPVTYTTPGSTIYIAFAARYDDLPKVADEEPLPSLHVPAAIATTPTSRLSSLPAIGNAKQRDEETDIDTEKMEKKKDKKRDEPKERKLSDAKPTSPKEDARVRSREQRSKSLEAVKPSIELKSSVIIDMLKSPDRAISLAEDSQNLYLPIISDKKRSLYLELLRRDDHSQYFMKFVKIIESNITTGPLAIEGKMTCLCKYELWKKGRKDAKVKLPEGALMEDPGRFHKFVILWHTAKS
jgi:hypothetical protein